jgi:hypothetical protein
MALDQLSFSFERAQTDPNKPKKKQQAYCLACARFHTSDGGWRPATVRAESGTVQIFASSRVVRHHPVDVKEQALHTRLQEYHDTVQQLQLWECTLNKSSSSC